MLHKKCTFQNTLSTLPPLDPCPRYCSCIMRWISASIGSSLFRGALGNETVPFAASRHESGSPNQPAESRLNQTPKSPSVEDLVGEGGAAEPATWHTHTHTHASWHTQNSRSFKCTASQHLRAEGKQPLITPRSSKLPRDGLMTASMSCMSLLHPKRQLLQASSRVMPSETCHVPQILGQFFVYQPKGSSIHSTWKAPVLKLVLCVQKRNNCPPKSKLTHQPSLNHEFSSSKYCLNPDL